MEQRFWEKVAVGKPWECWEWRSYIHPKGYGTFSMNSIAIFAHRASWILSFGDIPDKMHVLHRCHNRPCVNPNHLYLGTPADNARDGTKSQKLSISDVEYIKVLLKDRTFAQWQIADMFGVCFWTIAGISQGKRWA